MNPFTNPRISPYDILNAVYRAADAIMEVYGQAEIESEKKDDNSPVTIADIRAHNIIEETIIKSGWPILSEEGEHASYEVRENWDYFWVVDPLDGTKEFIKRNGEFTVNIALIENNRFSLLENLTNQTLAIASEHDWVEFASVEIDKPHALRFADSVSMELSYQKSAS